MRYYNPSFKLFEKLMPLAGREDLQQKLADAFKHTDKDKAGDKFMTTVIRATAAVGLRWAISSDMGMPSRPFKVYRRAPDYKDLVHAAAASTTVFGAQDIPFATYAYIVGAQIAPTPGMLMTVVARDADGVDIPGSTATYSATLPYIFKWPGVSSLHVTGFGQVNNLSVIYAAELINATGWEHIQTVGLPVDAPPAAYALQPQGWLPDELMHPHKAAVMRMAVGQLFYDAPPPLPADLSPVVWPAAPPEPYLQYINGMLNSIMDMLQASAFPFAQQDFTVPQTVAGLRQAGTPSSGVEDADVDVPVLGTTLLSIVTDSDASLAFGFGTTDFLRLSGNTANTNGNIPGITHGDLVQAAVVLPALPPDYMVVADYHTTFLGDYSWATLSQPMPAAETPAYVDAAKGAVQRPLTADDFASQTVTLSWPVSGFPQGNAIVVSPKTSAGIMANNEVALSGGVKIRLPYAGQSGQMVGDVWMPLPILKYVLPGIVLPKSGFASYRFFVAARNVMAAWSAFRERDLHIDALPPQMPGLTAVSLEQDMSRAIAGNQVPVKLTIEFTWDWEDRTPGIIYLAGGYYMPSAAAVPLINNTFSVKAVPDAGDGFVQIDFGLTAGKKDHTKPFIVNNAAAGKVHGTVVLVADPGEQYRFRYRVIFTQINGNALGVVAVFAGALHKAGFSASAAATELGRADLSAWTPPLKDILIDPRAPETPHLPEDIQLTALPDATRLARGVLSWPAISGAAGYNVWEATETALIETIGTASAPADNSLQARATFLRNLITAHETKSLRAFARLNEQWLPATAQPHTELALPGATDKLYVYRVSAVNERNVESGKSGIVFFAVPQVITPPIPLVSVKKVAAGIELTIATPTGVAPAGYNVHRVRHYLPSDDVGMKGPAVLTPASPGWTDTTMAIPGSTALRPAKRIVDTGVAAAPSWKPIYYQVTAVGAADVLNGKKSGISKASRSVEAFFPPLAAPAITLIATSSNASSTLIKFSALLPVAPISLGKATIEIAVVTTDPVTNIPARKVEAFSATEEISLNAAGMVLAGPAASGKPALMVYSLAGGTPVFWVRIHHPLTVGTGAITITVTDPLGRTATHSF